MSRASPAISDADSRDSSQNTCSTEDSSVTYNPRGRTSSSARSTSTEITKASGTSEGTSYLTVETTKTETENRSWFEQFWAWYLSDDKQDSNRVEERQEKNLKDDDSADCEVASRASECSQASDLITEDGSQIYGLQGSVKYDEHTHLTNKKCDDEKVFLFGEFEEQDVDKDDDKPLDAIARHSSFVRQPRESPRPFTPRHRAEEQSRLGESQLLAKRNESPSPSPSPVISTIQMRSSKSSTLAEGKDERQDERSMSRGETNEQPEKKRELPPRPHSSFVFRPRPLLSAMKRNRSLGPSNLVDETNLKQSDSHNSTTSTSRHNSSTPHQVSHIRLEKVEGKIPKKASVQERIQTFEAAPLGIMTDESTIDREEPDFTLNKDEKKKDSSSTLRTNEKAKNSPVALTMNEREGHSPIDGSSRFGIRSLGARKRFGTPVFFRAASFDGVLTLDSSPSHISREVRNNSTSIVNGNNKPRANILPQEKSLVGGKKTKKLPGSDKEKNHNQFSGSAAVFMSLFSESDEKSPSVTLTKTPNHHDIPSVTSDPKKSLDTTNAKNVNGKLAGNLTVLMEPKAGAISNKRQPKRKGDREKVMLTQLKTYRSFS